MVMLQNQAAVKDVSWEKCFNIYFSGRLLANFYSFIFLVTKLMYNKEMTWMNQDCNILHNKSRVEVLFSKNENKKSDTY